MPPILMEIDEIIKKMLGKVKRSWRSSYVFRRAKTELYKDEDWKTSKTQKSQNRKDF